MAGSFPACAPYGVLAPYLLPRKVNGTAPPHEPCYLVWHHVGNLRVNCLHVHTLLNRRPNHIPIESLRAFRRCGTPSKEATVLYKRLDRGRARQDSYNVSLLSVFQNRRFPFTVLTRYQDLLGPDHPWVHDFEK